MTAIASGPVLGGLLRRSVLRLRRMPSVLVPALVMPLFFLVSYSGSFDGLTNVEGYGTDNIVNWMVAWSLMMAASFSGSGASGVIGTDIDTGFLDRLLMAPSDRWVVLAGPLLYSMVRAAISTTLVLIAAALLGADFPGGVLGLLSTYVGCAGMALAIGCLGSWVMLVMRDVQAQALVQLMIFGGTFLSIGQVPVDFMTGWLKVVARYNPVTFVLRLIRQGFLGPVAWDTTWPGLVALAGMTVLFGGLALRTLYRYES
ncbi:MAG: ABC transporter permease [Acidimicrobiales bacterium]|nr:ABC transporter permease [Acidimicrobiales bacterium]